MEYVSILNTAMLIVGALLVSLLIQGAGLFVLAVSNKSFSGNIEQEEFLPVYSLVVGYATIVMALYLFSFIGVLTSQSVQALLACQLALTFIIRGHITAMYKSLFVRTNSYMRSLGSFERRVVYLTSAILCVSFIIGLIVCSYPSLDADTATTYLNAAKLFLQYHHLIDVGNAVGNMAKSGFMITVYGMGIHSDLLAHLLLFIFSFAGIVGIYVFLCKRTHVAAASLVIVCWATTNYQWEYAFLPVKFDGITFTLSAVALISLWRMIFNDRSVGLLIVNAAAVGLLGGISYNNLLAVLLFGSVVLVYLFLQSKQKTGTSRLLLIWLLVFVSVIIPGYLFNAITFRNPLYPFGGALFGTGYGYNIGPGTNAFAYIHSLAKDWRVNNLVDFVVLPFGYVQNPDKFQTSKDYIFSLLLAISYVVMPFYLFNIVSKYIRTRNSELMGVIFVVVGFFVMYVFWAHTQHILRYLAVAMPLLLLLVCYEVLFLSNMLKINSGVWKMVLIGVIAVVFMYGLRPTLKLCKQPVIDIVYGRSVDDIIRQRFLYLTEIGLSRFGEAIIGTKKMLQFNDKVLSFLTGNYYFGSNAIVFSGNGSVSFPSRHSFSKPIFQYKDCYQYIAELKQNGFKYVVINPNYLFLSREEDQIIRDFILKVEPYCVIQGTLIYRL